MRRRRTGLLILSLASLLLGAASPAPAAPAVRGPVAIGVGAREFSLSLYRAKVKPGAVRFNVTNFGQDGHDLVVVAPNGKVVGRLSELKGSGGRGNVEVALRRPGTYALYCTIADHAARGMRAKLRVVR
jgi:plastocyanin